MRAARRSLPAVATAALLAGALACARPPIEEGVDSAGGPASAAAPTAPTAMRPLDAAARVLETQNAALDEPETRVVRDAAGWRTLWAQLHGNVPVDPPPAVDFAREMLVLVAVGQQSSGGHTLVVEGTSVAADGALVVHARHEAPGEGCMSTAVMTAPAIVVRLPRHAGAVRGAVRRVATRC